MLLGTFCFHFLYSHIVQEVKENHFDRVDSVTKAFFRFVLLTHELRGEKFFLVSYVLCGETVLTVQHGDSNKDFSFHTDNANSAVVKSKIAQRGKNHQIPSVHQVLVSSLRVERLSWNFFLFHPLSLEEWRGISREEEEVPEIEDCGGGGGVR